MGLQVTLIMMSPNPGSPLPLLASKIRIYKQNDRSSSAVLFLASLTGTPLKQLRVAYPQWNGCTT